MNIYEEILKLEKSMISAEIPISLIENDKLLELRIIDNKIIEEYISELIYKYHDPVAVIRIVESTLIW